MNDYGNSAAAGGLMAVLGTFFLFFLAIMVFFIACMWKIFTKAGKPGWAALIPIYNTIVMLEIVGKPIWWIVLFLIPLVNLVVAIMLLVELAKSYGQSTGFALGLLFLPVIFYPILAFGSSTYVGPGGVPAPSPSPAM